MTTNTLMFDHRILTRRTPDVKQSALLIAGGEHIDVEVEIIDIGPLKGIRWTVPAPRAQDAPEPPRATPLPSGITRNRYYKGSHIAVPEDIREAMRAMPYPELVEFARKVQSKPHHLTNLGPKMTIALHDAIRRQMGSEKESGLPLLPELPE